MPVSLSGMPKRYCMLLLQYIFEKNGAAVQNQFDRGQRCSWCGRYEEPSGAVLLWLWHSVLWRRMIDLPLNSNINFVGALRSYFMCCKKVQKGKNASERSSQVPKKCQEASESKPSNRHQFDVASVAVLQDSPEVVAARQAWREKETKRQASRLPWSLQCLAAILMFRCTVYCILHIIIWYWNCGRYCMVFYEITWCMRTYLDCLGQRMRSGCIG